jgi:hypothetical protein
MFEMTAHTTICLLLRAICNCGTIGERTVTKAQDGLLNLRGFPLVTGNNGFDIFKMI